MSDIDIAKAKAMTEYTVKDGDTLQSIARQVFGTVKRWPELWAMNKAAIEQSQKLEARRLRKMTGPDWIFPGTKLRLP